MNLTSEDLRSSAVVVWLPPGETPDDDDFDPENVSPPPVPNPEPWWELREAIQHVVETAASATHGKQPWIKIGNRVLTPQDIRAAYGTYGLASDAPGRLS